MASVSSRGFVVAAPTSSCGKTLVATGLMAALHRRGLNVQPFKVGPDFVDGLHHRVACNKPCLNLDSVLSGGKEPVHALFCHAMQPSMQVDVAVVEGVMGLFDGKEGRTEAGSTAEVAKGLRLPVILVVDCSAMSRIRDAIESCAGESTAKIPFLGWLPYRHDIRIPERHLGLHLPCDMSSTESHSTPEYISRLADWVEAGVDIPRLLELSSITVATVPPSGGKLRWPSSPPASRPGRSWRSGSARQSFARTRPCRTRAR